MKNEAVKIYQSNTINLLMQFDTKHDEAHDDMFQLNYYVQTRLLQSKNILLTQNSKPFA